MAGFVTNALFTLAANDNPLLEPSPLPFGAPDFTRIRTEHYLPALKAGIEQARLEVQKIVENAAVPTFQNTILAFESSGLLLDRVSNVFFCLTSADKTDEIAAIQKEITPLLTAYENEISFNEKLFERVKYVYDHEFTSLQGEDKKLLEETYKEFVRSGALLPKEKKVRIEEINKRISELQINWGKQIPDATNNAVVWVDNVKQ